MSKRQHLNQVFKTTGTLPTELEEEVKPDFENEPLFNLFFELYQRGQNFYQTLYYYQQIFNFEFDGEETSMLLILWNTAEHFLNEKDKKRQSKGTKASNTKPSRRGRK